MTPTIVENRRILVIDDEPEIRAGYRAFLNPPRAPKIASSRAQAPADDTAATYDFEIVEAESGERALEIVRSELAAGRRFAGCVVDVRMPGRLDGLQFIQKAWELDSGLLMVVVTAYQDRSVDEIGRMFGARFQDQWDYLSKPFTSGEIVQKARSMVSSWNRRYREHRYLEMISEQSRALVRQEQLAAVGRLAHTVGHDLGNVLQQVITKLEVEGRDNGELIEAVELGSSICQDLLTFARRPHDAPPSAAIALQAPVVKAARLLRQQLRRRAITLVVDIDEKADVKAHESRLVQVFVNLMTNAIQATADGGTLKIVGRRDGEGAWVEVSDTGVGIAADILPRIFEPLFSTKGDSGNGLGLSVCRNIVEAFKGKITVESQPGRGTTFRIVFP